jgi:hypothetical protein
MGVCGYGFESSILLLQLFDTENVVNRQALDYIFTTEGHVIRLDPAYRVNPWEQRLKGKGALIKANETFLEHSVSFLGQ